MLSRLVFIIKVNISYNSIINMPYYVIIIAEVDSNGKGRYYKGVIDCGYKIIKVEGFFGVYKGVGPFYLRVAPHTVLCLTFWEHLKRIFDDKNVLVVTKEMPR